MTTVRETYEMECPSCKEDSDIIVSITTKARLRSDGSDALDGDHEWEDDSAAWCACGFEGKVRNFKIKSTKVWSIILAWNDGDSEQGTYGTCVAAATKEEAEYLARKEMMAQASDDYVDGEFVDEFRVLTAIEGVNISMAEELVDAAQAVLDNWDRGDLATSVRSLAKAIARAKSEGAG